MKQSGSPPKPAKLYWGQAEEAALAYDNAAYKLRSDNARLNFPHLRHNWLVSGVGCEYNPLHSSVTAKLDEICQSLVDGKSIDVCKKSRKSTIKSRTVAEAGKVKGSNSDVCSGSSDSSQSSGLMFPELAAEESVWYDSENFSLQKCLPYEIDWGSI
uniref:AP2/ERF domain-containing protein n=1 Tax=Tanacetum cinerariifolium TaxID=118510 RepID=A0A699JVQ1_TANCI|nr:hypothetical protein [Tanacetum cinerariifolium]